MFCCVMSYNRAGDCKVLAYNLTGSAQRPRRILRIKKCHRLDDESDGSGARASRHPRECHQPYGRHVRARAPSLGRPREERQNAVQNPFRKVSTLDSFFYV